MILAGLLDYLCAQQKLRGAGFTVAVPATPEQAALLQDKGFARAFALRCLPREVARNLWSQAEFDSVTAKKLCELRETFWPDTCSSPRSAWPWCWGICIPAGPPSWPTSGLRRVLPQGGHPVFRGAHGRGRPRRRGAHGSRPREGSHRGKGRHHGGCRPVPVPRGGHPAGVRHDPF